jgi:hypothetical protein
MLGLPERKTHLSSIYNRLSDITEMFETGYMWLTEEHKVMIKQSFETIARLAFIAVALLACTTTAQAQCDGFKSWWERDICPGTGAFGGDSIVGGSLSFNQDAFFGNYTIANAGIAVNDRVDVTFYSILWHTEFFSQSTLGQGAEVPGTGLWTEFGGGLNFKALDGAFNLNPQIGILNGGLLSGGAAAGAGGPLAFEGIVPNTIASFDGTFFESEFYMGYYVATRGDRGRNADFLHWWYNAGIKPWGDMDDWKSTLSTGIHYENLRNTIADANLYQWLGPYFQVALPNNLSMRFTAGWDVSETPFLQSDNFYKVNLAYAF